MCRSGAKKLLKSFRSGFHGILNKARRPAQMFINKNLLEVDKIKDMKSPKKQVNLISGLGDIANKDQGVF